jgi:glycosyltransferase involved in cell wall biosynthesis
LDPGNLIEYPLKRRLYAAVKRCVARCAQRNVDVYVAVSAYAQEIGVEWLGIEPERIFVVYHGGPRPRVRPAPYPTLARRLLFVGHANPYKNIHRLVAALSLAPVELELDIVGASGSGSYQQEVAQLVSSLDLDERVRFHGACSSKEVADWFEHSDVFVWPSYGETFGHPLLEAHSFGLPIIAADVPVNRELAGDGAVYHDPFDVLALAGLLSRAARGLLPDLGAARECSWDRCVKELVSVLGRAQVGGGYRT